MEVINELLDGKALLAAVMLLAFFLFLRFTFILVVELLNSPYEKIFTSIKKRNKRVINNSLKLWLLLSFMMVAFHYSLENIPIQVFTDDNKLNPEFITIVIAALIILVPFITVPAVYLLSTGLKKYKVEYKNEEYIIHDTSEDGNRILLVKGNPPTIEEYIQVSIEDIKDMKITKVEKEKKSKKRKKDELNKDKIIRERIKTLFKK